jgi:glucosamine--fructose-6-phosphate aminotransferase (isomerizing)
LKHPTPPAAKVDPAHLKALADQIDSSGHPPGKDDTVVPKDAYLGGPKTTEALWQAVWALKRQPIFCEIFSRPDFLTELNQLSKKLAAVLARENAWFGERIGWLDAGSVEVVQAQIEKIKDIVWSLDTEIAANVDKIKDLMGSSSPPPTPVTLAIYKNINAVLNSIDRLEVRGRDSAGISLMFILDKKAFGIFQDEINQPQNLGLQEELKKRLAQAVLVNKGLSINENSDGLVSLTLTYKVAAEIGSLGDNIRFLRHQITHDVLLKQLIPLPHLYHTVSAHTRWASVGAITEPNCHPVDNDANIIGGERRGTIHACLNGDIDNYMALKDVYEKSGRRIDRHITTDTKIIPMHIESYLQKGHDVETAFRLAVNDFDGSHAISMHTDLAPGKLFLAQRGSGQAIFVGLADDHYIPTSEVYGFVEETQRFVRLDGEKAVEGKNGLTQGQIFILDQASKGGLEGLHAFYYDGTPVGLSDKNVKRTQITSRDIDRQGFSHYFIKEISESPALIKKTLQNRWKVAQKEGQSFLSVMLDEFSFPKALQQAVIDQKIRRIFFVGQGTACMAAQACADILNYYVDDPHLPITGLRASELSGFKLNEKINGGMQDTLVVAISQSGTTTDTNRAVDMAKERGAHTLAIVNRRDSDLTFKAEGVIYPGSGRDIEMSVASTKALYSQIVAGAILGLFIARLKGRRSDEFISEEIRQLLKLPEQMEKILAMRGRIEACARKHAVTKIYWAAVGSGPNKTAADEIRIKLSELCYKTISSDCVEDKKHIDLSSEPLIIVCAAGAKPTVLGDLIKDTAIFKAHKATPIVIADEGEDRFDPYAAEVFHIPSVSQHFAPIVNIMAGHIWGYHAALAINEGSRFFYNIREDVQQTLDQYAEKGMDVYEVILEKPFREKILRFYTEFKKKKDERRFSTAMSLESATDLTLLFKYLAGRLPVSDFELDFGIKGTARKMIDTLFARLGEAIALMARPVDAIKHQAKTVTVGTSRISEKLEGILFDALTDHGLSAAQLTNSNILVLRNLQALVAAIQGSILYRIGGLNLLGEPTDDTSIEVLKKEGILKAIPSRVETDTHLKGTKRIIVRQGNIYIGKGRKDDRSIIIIPLISTSSAAPNLIENLLLLNIAFKEEIPLPAKIKALGGKYEHIKNIVHENSVAWDDQVLLSINTGDLFGLSAEKIAEDIVASRSQR